MMERKGQLTDCNGIIQQGPELKDGPQTETSANVVSPRVYRQPLSSAGEAEAHNFEDSSGSYSAINSPSPLKRRPAGDRPNVGIAAGNVFADAEQTIIRHPLAAGRRATPESPNDSEAYFLNQRPPVIASYAGDPAITFSPELISRASSGQLHGHATIGRAGSFEPSVCNSPRGPAPTSFVPQQAVYFYQQPAVYAATPGYYYAVAQHGPPHPYLIAPAQTATSQGPWIYAPALAPALFKQPLASSSPTHQSPASFRSQRSSRDDESADDYSSYQRDCHPLGSMQHAECVANQLRQSPSTSGDGCQEVHDDDWALGDELAPAATKYGKGQCSTATPSRRGRDEDRYCGDEQAAARHVYTSTTGAIHRFGDHVATDAGSEKMRSEDETRAAASGSPTDRPNSIDQRLPDQEIGAREHRDEPCRPECATAFTIEFTDEGDSTRMTALDRWQAAERNWKSQSAERIHRNFVRRSLRRGEAAASDVELEPNVRLPPSGLQERSDQPPAPASNVKRYLFEKMLSATPDRHRTSPRSAGADVERGASDRLSPGGPLSLEPDCLRSKSRGRESDACSDAGTYVVEQEDEDGFIATSKAERAASDTTRNVDDSDCEEPPALTMTSQCDDIVHEPVITPRFRNRVSVQSRPPSDIGSVVSEEFTSTSEERERPSGPDGNDRRDLLKRLIKITTPTPPKTSTPPTKVDSGTPKLQLASASSRRSIGPNTAKPAAHKRASMGLSSASSISRGDTGRSSSVSAASRNPAVASKAAAAKASPGKSQTTKESETMKNWLRRKEYNPMKAAADAKRNKTTPVAPSSASQQQQQHRPSGQRKNEEEPIYLSSRSRSFHLGTVLAEASQSASPPTLKKHPSVYDDVRQGGVAFNFYGDDDECEDETDAGVVSDSAAISSRGQLRSAAQLARTPPLDQVTMRRLASLSQELGQRARRVLTKVNKSAGGSEGESQTERNTEKEAALAAVLNQLRVASRALEEVDKILPDDKRPDDDPVRDEATRINADGSTVPGSGSCPGRPAKLTPAMAKGTFQV